MQLRWLKALFSASAPEEAAVEDEVIQVDMRRWAPDENEPTLVCLLGLVDVICNPEVGSMSKGEALCRLALSIQPPRLPPETKDKFIQVAVGRGVIEASVGLIELGDVKLASVACDFLGDLSLNSDVGSQSVLKSFARVIGVLTRIFATLTTEHLPLVGSAVALCANIVAQCPESHAHSIPLVLSVFLPIIRDHKASDKLVGSTILLLANLSTSVGQSLRELEVADVLLRLVLDGGASKRRKMVAESVIIYLLGHKPCTEVDGLIAHGVIRNYCVPILECALAGTEFRGMYPHLMYSVRLFRVLSQSRAYAEALMSHEGVLPLLLQASQRMGHEVRLESDHEGRRLALESLVSFARFRLWPRGKDHATDFFVANLLHVLLEDDHVGVRTAAAGLWACLNSNHMEFLQLLGHRFEAEGRLPPQLWSGSILGFLFPDLSAL